MCPSFLETMIFHRFSLGSLATGRRFGICVVMLRLIWADTPIYEQKRAFFHGH